MPTFQTLSRFLLTTATLGLLFGAADANAACMPWEYCGPPGYEGACPGPMYSCVQGMGPGPVWCRDDWDLQPCRGAGWSRTCCHPGTMCAINHANEAYCATTCPAGSTQCGQACCPNTGVCIDAATSTCDWTPSAQSSSESSAWTPEEQESSEACTQ